MIFYFTGTGNSWYAATKLLKDGEELINMADCMKEKKYSFEVKDGEAVGFSFPVYYGGLPSLVQAFLSRLVLNGPVDYVYGLLTYGGFTVGAGDMLRRRLAESGILLDAVYSVKMPENYCLLYQTPEEEEIKDTLELADADLAVIKDSIELLTENDCEASVLMQAATAGMYTAYRKGRKTAAYHVDDRCVGCGTCAKRCPIGAIQMQVEDDGSLRPVWIKDRCVMCMACCRCNAVQYGSKTKKRRRYVNPEYKKITCCE